MLLSDPGSQSVRKALPSPLAQAAHVPPCGQPHLSQEGDAQEESATQTLPLRLPTNDVRSPRKLGLYEYLTCGPLRRSLEKVGVSFFNERVIGFAKVRVQHQSCLYLRLSLKCTH